MSEAVAHAVRTGYDVISENIRLGREAAERFRQGEYNVRDVPGDLETVLLRLINLAREVSTTTFDVCERLLKEMGPAKAGTEGGATVPPFRQPSPPPKPPAAASGDAGRLPLTVRFDSGAKATALTAALDRPRGPTRAQDITAGPLVCRQGGQIPGVAFETDVSVEGLVAVVTIPDGAAAGIYSGLVYARGDDVPLGVLSVEIPA